VLGVVSILGLDPSSSQRPFPNSSVLATFPLWFQFWNYFSKFKTHQKLEPVDIGMYQCCLVIQFSLVINMYN
jgi:hypothetical protein